MVSAVRSLPKSIGLSTITSFFGVFTGAGALLVGAAHKATHSPAVATPAPAKIGHNRMFTIQIYAVA